MLLTEQQKVIDSTLATWMGNEEQIDDICLIGVKIT